MALGEWSPDGGMHVLSMERLPEGRDSRYFNSFKKLSKETGILKGDIKAIVVGLGPGSYGGIRSAISVAYGWHLANDAKLFGLSSAQVLARKAFEETGQSSLHTLIDAQRGECYHAQFNQSGSGNTQEAQPLTIKDSEQLGSAIQSQSCCVGEDVKRWFPDGGVIMHHTHPDAASLLKEASALMGQPGKEKLEPIYLRPTSFVKAPPTRIPIPEQGTNNH